MSVVVEVIPALSTTFESRFAPKDRVWTDGGGAPRPRLSGPQGTRPERTSARTPTLCGDAAGEGQKQPLPPHVWAPRDGTVRFSHRCLRCRRCPSGILKANKSRTN